MSTEGLINQANGRLKAGKIGIVIQALGNKLYFRGKFPPKPGSTQTKPHQQRLALGINANVKGISYAEQEAKIVGGKLAEKSFRWEDYLDIKPDTIATWIEKLEEKFNINKSIQPVTWKTHYLKSFKLLPQDEPLTTALLEKIIVSKSSPNTRTRKRLCEAFGKLAEIAEIDFYTKYLKGNYSAKRVNPRDLPSDKEIFKTYYTIPYEPWRYIYGLIAIYGMRPHEAFLLDFEKIQRSPIINILEGKTGARTTWPFYPEWIDEFKAQSPLLPDITWKDHTDIGQRIASAFYRYKLPIKAYDLRHCWARRTLEFGLDISLAAQQMGHSVSVHSDIYHAWITEDVHDRAYRVLMSNPNRPKAPTMLE
ncbi:MAG: site-specific integrase [Cyanobacteria bacterium P01_E01_bin.42]